MSSGAEAVKQYVSLSDEIKQARFGAVSNPYQGKDRKVLFVCSMGILRSATGARIYAHKYNTRCAGTYDEALIQVSIPLLSWADHIVFVHKDNYQQAVQFCYDHAESDQFPHEVMDKSFVLTIPDQYEHMHPEIIKAYNEQYEPVNVS